MHYLESEFGDGLYTFKLGLAQIHELEQKCGVGIGALYGRVLKGRYDADGEIVIMPAHAEYYASDLVETIRQGLLGGNQGVVDETEIKVTPALAQRLINTYVIPRPLAEGWNLAAAILTACILGYEPPKKDEPAERPATEGSTTRKRSRTAR